MTVEELIKQNNISKDKRIEFIFADRNFCNINIPADSFELENCEYSKGDNPFRHKLKEFDVVYWTTDCHYDNGKKNEYADYMIIVREFTSKIAWTDKEGCSHSLWFEDMDTVEAKY